MYKQKKILAFIPARSGSKRLPGKNIKLFLGKPLLYWTIKQAKLSKYIDTIIVSTEDTKIASIARNYGAEAPFLRPKKLAGDRTSTEEVVLDFLNRWKYITKCTPDYIVLLQPTSPLRGLSDIDSAIHRLLLCKKADAIVGITEVSKNLHSLKFVSKKGFLYPLGDKCKRYSRTIFKTNGAVYVINTLSLLKEKTFFPKRTLGYIMPADSSVDIDKIENFELAQILFTKNKSSLS